MTIFSKLITIHSPHSEDSYYLAEIFPDISVINGDALDPEILDEAGISNSETFVAVSNNDEVNILSSLLAKRSGALRAVTLVNLPGFIPLVNTLGINSVISLSLIHI